MRGYAKSGVREAIRDAGGEIYAITSEPQSLATSAQEEWETGLVHVGDPHQEIAGECKRRGWISLFKNLQIKGNVDRIASWVSHPGGYFQPGVLVISREGRVLYRWRLRPTRQNIGGAIARPVPTHVWERVKAALAEPEGTPDVPYDDEPVLDAPPISWPFFATLLFANGWFLRAKPFDQRADDTVERRQRNAMLRIPLFVALWVAAAIILPSWMVALLFVGWIGLITPRVRSMHKNIQTVGPEEEPA